MDSRSISGFHYPLPIRAVICPHCLSAMSARDGATPGKVTWLNKDFVSEVVPLGVIYFCDNCEFQVPSMVLVFESDIDQEAWGAFLAELKDRIRRKSEGLGG
jgi:hypothetical protein